MSELQINGIDLEPYMPTNLCDSEKEKLFLLSLGIKERVEKQLSIALSYGGIKRVLNPHSLFVQTSTPDSSAIIRDRSKPYTTRMKVYNKGARRTIGIDAIEVRSERKGPEWWKTLHLDKVDDRRLLTFEEVAHIVRPGEDASILETPFESQEDFVWNWNYWFRTYIAQAGAKYDLNVPR